MSAPARFLFETDFAAGNRAANTITLAEHREKLSEAETRGYAGGFAAAKAEAEAETARRVALALESISRQLGTVVQSLGAVEAKFEAEAVEVAVAAARKLAHELVSREPFAEIAALFTDCLRHLTAAPHIVVRVADSIYPQAREKLESIAQNLGFSGRLVIMAEPGMKADDCRIEWADGGVTRDRATVDLAISETVGRYLAARGSTSAVLKGEQE
ncbi:MAG TPA: FliH/SctL family protein [Pseudorhodoplanes sp.]|jgi:flagellar assembly protein FliH|nr:FliH/SctL family protein [Pseudorhodoplanes sp.]